MAVVAYYSLLIFILFAHDIDGKVYKHALTESMGQEVIEIASPIKELPPDLEEEPSAENFDSKSTSTTVAAATQNLQQRNNSRSIKNQEKDEEARIEKELADLYKDPDYKGDSGEYTKTTEEALTTLEAMAPNNDTDMPEKPVARSKYMFEPDELSSRGIARFRTKVDKIDCKNKLIHEENVGTEPGEHNPETTSEASRVLTSIVLCLISSVTFSYFNRTTTTRRTSPSSGRRWMKYTATGSRICVSRAQPQAMQVAWSPA